MLLLKKKIHQTLIINNKDFFLEKYWEKYVFKKIIENCSTLRKISIY